MLDDPNSFRRMSQTSIVHELNSQRLVRLVRSSTLGLGFTGLKFSSHSRKKKREREKAGRRKEREDKRQRSHSYLLLRPLLLDESGMRSVDIFFFTYVPRYSSSEIFPSLFVSNASKFSCYNKTEQQSSSHKTFY